VDRFGTKYAIHAAMILEHQHRVNPLNFHRDRLGIRDEGEGDLMPRVYFFTTRRYGQLGLLPCVAKSKSPLFGGNQRRVRFVVQCGESKKTK
jgi:hypothetical protein